MGGGYGGDEKLRSVGVGTGVSHGKKSGLVVTKGELLILEFVSVDGLATTTGAFGEVTALKMSK